MPQSENPDSSKKQKAMARLRNKLTKEMLWIYILRLLQERPHYSYEIKELVKRRFEFAPALVSGYAIIYKMKREGLIEEEQISSDSPRKYYSITDQGRIAMKEAKQFLAKTIESVFDMTD
jgi:DNA-binding PadR family transcriptional regulator